MIIEDSFNMSIAAILRMPSLAPVADPTRDGGLRRRL